MITFARDLIFALLSEFKSDLSYAKYNILFDVKPLSEYVSVAEAEIAVESLVLSTETELQDARTKNRKVNKV